MHDHYKVGEYQIYKEFHKVVLNDDGCPTLKKSAFRMPGYRKVLGNQTKEYEIDNTAQAIDRVIVPEEVVDSDGSRDPSNDQLAENVSELNTPEWRKR